MHHTSTQYCIGCRVHDRSGRMVNRLKAEAMSETMFESRAKSRASHHTASLTIYSTPRRPVAYTLQYSVLCCDTGLMCFAPLIADGACKEGAREFRPVAVN